MQTLALLRHFRSDWVVLVALFLLVTLTAAIVAAIPRVYNRVVDDEIGYQLERSPADIRNITVTRERRVTVAEDEHITDVLGSAGQEYLDNLDPELQNIISGQNVLTQSQQMFVTPIRHQPISSKARTLEFRIQSGIEQHTRLIAGHWPRQHGPVRTSEITGTPAARGEQPYPVYEIAISRQTVEGLEMPLGSWTRLSTAAGVGSILVRVSGVFEVLDPDANFWNADETVSEPVITGFASDFAETYHGVGIFPTDEYRAVQAQVGSAPWQQRWTFFVDPERVNAGNARPLTAEMRQLQANLGPIETLPGAAAFGESSQDEIRNDIPAMLESVALQSRLVSAVVALIGIGILVVGLIALGALASLIAERRRSMTTLLRARGASRRQLAQTQLVEGLILCLPAAMLGGALALALVDARGSRWTLIGALATGALAIALLFISSHRNLFADLGQILSSSGAGIRSFSLRRTVFEGAIVVLAIAGVLLLRRRGFTSDTGGEGFSDFDPFLTAVPVLLALAVGIVAIRIYPLAMQLLLWPARWLRGVLSLVGLRRMSAGQSATSLALLVLIVTTGVSVFIALINSSVERAQIDYSWQQVHADFRVEAATTLETISPQIDFGQTPGAEITARALQLNNTEIAPADASAAFTVNEPRLTFLALDAGEFSQITQDTAVDTAFPESILIGPAGDQPGTESNPIPALISNGWPEEAGDRPDRGDLVTLELKSPQFSGTIPLVFEVMEFRGDFPGVSDASDFLVADWDAVAAGIAVERSHVLRPTTIYLNGATESADIRATVAEQTVAASDDDDPTVPALRVISREQLSQELIHAPLPSGLDDGLRLSTGIAILYGALTLFITMLLTARRRQRDLTYLRTLGLSRRQALQLVIIETVPMVLIACVIGAGFGVTIVRTIAPGIDLTAFAGPDVPVGIVTNVALIALVTGVLALTAIICVVVFSALARRVQIGALLRVGDE